MEYGRIFNKARQEQGFKSQEHLDGFYKHYDHTHTCVECLKPGPGVLLDDGYQPTQNECSVAKALYSDYCAITDRTPMEKAA